MIKPTLGRLVAGCLLVFAAPELAYGETRTTPHVVEIHVDGKPAAVAQTRSVATEILLRISVMPVVLAEDAPAPNYSSPDEPFVRAYFDFRSAAPRLVIVDGKTQRELDRRVLPEGANLETSVEAVTHVLYMVVESLLDETATEKPTNADTADTSATSRARHVAPPDSSPEAVAPAASAPAKAEQSEQSERLEHSEQSEQRESAASSARPSALGVEAGVLFRTLYLGDSHLAPGGGLVVDLRADHSQPNVSVAFALALYAPLELTFGAGSARLQPFSVAVLPSLQTELGSSAVALFGAGASVTWFSLETQESEGVRGGSSAGGADLALGVAAGLRFRLGARFAATLSGALDVGIAPRAFIGSVGDQRHVLAELPRFRPFLSLSGTYSLLGSNEPGARAEVD